jgi:ribosomal protein L37AE/L43A
MLTDDLDGLPSMNDVCWVCEDEIVDRVATQFGLCIECTAVLQDFEGAEGGSA